MVPLDALIFEIESYFAYVDAGNGLFERRKVLIAPWNGRATHGWSRGSRRASAWSSAKRSRWTRSGITRTGKVPSNDDFSSRRSNRGAVMIRALMALALRERAVVIGAAVVLILAGFYSFAHLDIEAYPDPVQPMTEVLTLPSGLSAEEVEKLVTVPTEYAMSGMLSLKSMESISLYGLSDIRLYFDWDSDYEFDRTQTINQLQFVTLPQGITPGLSPENPIGEIYRYTVEGSDHDLVKEKEVEDWICEKQFKTVPGVLDVSGFGGLTKEYHVEVDPQKLAYYAIPLSQVITAVQNSNTNSGGSYLEVGEQAFDVRGIGLIHSLDDIRNIVLTSNKSTPIKVSNVADVSVGWAPRLGIVGMNYRDEVVEGIVLMRKHGNTLQTLKGSRRRPSSSTPAGSCRRAIR